MKNIYYSFSLFLAFMILTIAFFQLELIAARIFSINIEYYKQFLYGVSAVLSTLLTVSFILKKNIIQIKTRLKVSLKFARLMIFSGLIFLVICHALFSGTGSRDNEIVGNTLINYILPFVIVVPVSQELIFRNGIQELLSRAINTHFAISVTSVLFAVASALPDFQFTASGFIQSYFVSTILGYGYKYSGSILITITISSLYYLFVLITHYV